MGFRLRAATTVFLTTTVLATSTMAQEFELNRLFVLGDSLSDGGTYTQSSAVVLGNQNLTLPPDQQINIPTDPNFRFRFTDNQPDGSSRTYAEGLAERLGIDLQPNLITGVPIAAGTPFANDIPVGGTNFAQGGSQVDLDSPNQNQPLFSGGPTPTAIGVTQTPVSEQVTRLLNTVDQFNSEDLIILWAGNNDVLNNGGNILAAAGAVQAGMLPPAAIGVARNDALDAIDTAAAAYIEQVDRLQERGATNIVVVTIPDVGENTPLGNVQLADGGAAEGRAGFTELTQRFNDAVAGDLSARNVAVVDSNRLLQAVLDNPTQYGFSDVNQRTTFRCTTSAVQCIDGENTNPLTDGLALVFADTVHPTSQAQEVFADAAFAGLIAATLNGVIPVSTLTAIRQQAVSLDNRLNLTAVYEGSKDGEPIYREVGDFEVFAGGEVGFYSSDSEQIRPGLDATTQVVKIATDVAVAKGVTVGAGISFDHGQVDFDDNLGNIDSRLVIGAVYGVAEVIKGVYVNAALGYGYVDVFDINRNFQLGTSRESYSGDTEGEYFLAKVGFGATIPVGIPGLVVNPSVGLTYETVEIDGFDESFGAASLSFGDSEFESERLTLGLAGFYRPPAAPGWTFGLRGSYEYDFNDDRVEVTFGPDQDRLATLTAPRPDGQFGFLSAVIARDITEHSRIALQGSTVVGQDGISGIVGGLTYSHKF